MLTRPKLMLPFQIARAMRFALERVPEVSPTKRVGTQDACRALCHGNRSRSAESLRGPPPRPLPDPHLPWRQRDPVDPARPLLLAGRPEVRPTAGDRAGPLD